jgi:hypothetical protein
MDDTRPAAVRKPFTPAEEAQLAEAIAEFDALRARVNEDRDDDDEEVLDAPLVEEPASVPPAPVRVYAG